MPRIASAGVPDSFSGFVVSAYQRLIGVHRAVEVVLALGADDPARVAADDVAHAGLEQDLRDRDARGAEAGDEHAQVHQVAARQLAGVEQRGEHDDRGAVLVVVEDGDVELGP